MKTYHWLLDAGHGGMDSNGKYTTAPSKMFTFPDGLVFCEGHNNRQIVNRLAARLKEAGIRFTLIHDEVTDTPLHERTARANRLHAADKSCIYLSVHSDAMPLTSSGKGSGLSIYSSKGQTASDKIASIFASVYKKELSQFKFREDRSDGDADKEENFHVLSKTHCPALLVENLFFDNRREADFLMSVSGQEAITSALFHAILETEKQKPI